MKANLHMNDGVTIYHANEKMTFEEFIDYVFGKKVCILKSDNPHSTTVAVNVNRIIWVAEDKT
jgi:hypothetical protein